MHGALSASSSDSAGTTKKMLREGELTAGLGAAGRTGEIVTLQKLGESDAAALRHGTTRGEGIALDLEKAAIVAVAGGMAKVNAEEQFGLRRGYVDYALQRRFGSAEAAKKALQGLVLENAIACNVHAAGLVEEMTGPQAVMAGAILIDKALAIERSIVETPRTIDFAAFADLGESLRKIGEIVNQPTSESPTEATTV